MHIADLNQEFEAWKTVNPGGKFSVFSNAKTAPAILNGRKHPSLGSNLTSDIAWDQHGADQAAQVFDLSRADPAARICDYGCGTLRVGLHVMRRQNPDCYFGIDISPELVGIGAENVGAEIIAEKRPVLGTIANSLPRVVAAQVDVLFSFKVALHVHPDEQAEFNSNLAMICARPGSQIILNTVNSAYPIQFQKSGWAYPVASYAGWLNQFQLVNAIVSRPDKPKPGIPADADITTSVLHFVRR